MAAFTLAHLSDPHLPPLPAPTLGELAGKRALGYLNWTRNRRKVHRREVLDALVSDMLMQTPDHIAITGDLVNLALEAEFAPALRWLEGVGAPDDFVDDIVAFGLEYAATVRDDHRHFVEAFREGRIPGVSST